MEDIDPSKGQVRGWELVQGGRSISEHNLENLGPRRLVVVDRELVPLGLKLNYQMDISASVE